MGIEHKKFVDIQRLKVNYMNGFNKDDEIIIQEKIDGANAAIRTDGSKVYAQSRKNILDEGNTLRGFYEYVQSLDAGKLTDVLGTNWVLFGEWLVPHSVKYPEDKYRKFYVYDIYNTENECYLPQSVVKITAERLGLPYVPVFYEGTFTDWDTITALVGKTDMGGEYGEGIVVKNQTRIKAGVKMSDKLPPYVKIVSERFAETAAHKVKVVDPEKLAEAERQRTLTETIVTPARVEKILHKLVDEGVIPADWDETHMGTIAKNINKRVYEDCVKEENDVVEAVGEKFGKIAASITMAIVKEILKGR